MHIVEYYIKNDLKSFVTSIVQSLKIYYALELHFKYFISRRRSDSETLGAGFNAGYHHPFEFNAYILCDPSRPDCNTCSITFQKSIDLAWRGGMIHKKGQILPSHKDSRAETFR